MQTPQPKTETPTHYPVPADLFQAVINNLAEQPWKAVAPIMGALMEVAQLAGATMEPGAPPEE